MTFDPVPERPVWARALRVVLTIAIVVLSAVVVVGGASYLGRQVGQAVGSDDVSDSPVDVEPGQPVTVDIPAGSTGQDIGALLAAQGVVRSALEFEVAVRSVDAAQRLQAGTYEMVTLMDPSDVVAMLVTGPGPAVFRITVIEGLRIEEILTSLAEDTGNEYAEFEAALLEGDVSTSLLAMPEEPELTDWEGLLFPDTYEFSRSASPEDILQRLASTMEQRVNSIDWTGWEDLGYSVYEGIVAASIIETEIRVEDERPLASSVIYNRLELGMPLEMDATVLYALDTRDVSQFDRTVESPYNTYQVTGLPPTPIAAPGRASLEAAASPADTEFLYYVLSDFEGNHVFAETLEQHNANVAQAREDGVLP
jgi:UPF0755 protein